MQVRYDVDAEPLDAAAADALRQLAGAIELETLTIPPRRGQLILHANRRVLHGRTAVEGGPHPMARQAFRIWGMRDPRPLTEYQARRGAPIDPCAVILRSGGEA